MQGNQVMRMSHLLNYSNLFRLLRYFQDWHVHLFPWFIDYSENEYILHALVLYFYHGAFNIWSNVYKPIQSLDCASDLSRDKTLFTYNTRTEIRFQIFRPFLRKTFAHWLPLMIIQSQMMLMHGYKREVLDPWKSSHSLYVISSVNEQDFIPNLIKSETSLYEL